MADTGTATQNTRPASWTAEEDAKFVSILETEILTNGKTLEDVYPIAAEALGRPEGGCKYRYTNVIRKSLTGKLKEKLVDNSPRANVGKIATGVDRVATNRTNIITRIQQTNKELGKIDGEIAKAAKVLEDLKNKKIELGIDMKRYTDLLVQATTDTIEGQPADKA